MYKKRILAILVLVVIAIGIIIQHTSTTNGKKIMFIPKSTISSFWKITIDGFNTAISEYNYYGEIRSTENEEDVEGQSQIVLDAIAEDFDAIVISANNYELLAEPVLKAIKSGLEVVVIDSDVNVSEIDVRVSTDNYAAGFSMGEKMAESLDYCGEIGVLAFDTTTQNARERIGGFYDAIEQYDEIIVCAHEVTPSLEEQSRIITEQMIIDNPNIKGIATFNEIITVGLGNAVENLNRSDLVCVGFDNNSVLVDFLERGILDVIVIQNQFAMGYLGAEYAIKTLEGKNFSDLYVDTGTTIVTRENMYDLPMVLFPFYTDDEQSYVN